MKMLLFLTAFVALAAVAFWLSLLLLIATGDISVVPDDLLGEPGSCFAGC